MVGSLSRERNVKCYIYGQSLVNRSVLQIMKDHRYVRQVEENELSEFETFPILKVISTMNLGPAHIDVGRLAVNYFDRGEGASLSIEEYVRQSWRNWRVAATSQSTNRLTWCSMVSAGSGD